MDAAERTGRAWTAEEFLATDQHEFGPAWRYELVSGLIVAHAAPTPDHGAIAANLAGILRNGLRGASSRLPGRGRLRSGAQARAAEHRPHPRRDHPLRRISSRRV